MGLYSLGLMWLVLRTWPIMLLQEDQTGPSCAIARGPEGSFVTRVPLRQRSYRAAKGKMNADGVEETRSQLHETWLRRIYCLMPSPTFGL